MNKGFKAFTLAEVLITLGIIGVVAAMTIPTLISKYKEREILTKLQKEYATLQNAFKLSTVENGDFSTWRWNQIPVGDEKRIQYFWSNYIFPYLKVAKSCFPVSPECFSPDAKYLDGSALYRLSGRHAGIVLQDGTTLYSWASGDDYLPHVWIFVDVNGLASPNVVGQDIFAMFFTPKSPTISTGEEEEGVEEPTEDSFKYLEGLNFFAEGLPVEKYLGTNAYVRQESGGKSTVSCPKDGNSCGALIKASGWKFPDGYPKQF